MADSFDVNLKIGCAIGFNIAGGGISGNSPIQQTIRTLDGTTSTQIDYSAGARLLRVNELDTFYVPAFSSSTNQAVNLTNDGNSILTVTNIFYSFKDTVYPRFSFLTTSTPFANSGTISITPGNTATFYLAYTGRTIGEYSNFLIIESNNSSGYYRINTQQVVDNYADFVPIPDSYSTSTYGIGELSTARLRMVPVVNNRYRPDLSILPSASFLPKNAGWSVSGVGTNRVDVQFDSNDVGNVNGTYISTLTVTVNTVKHNIVNTAVVNIDPTKNKNYGSWISPKSLYNSIIAMSYDLVNGSRVLTIGVGLGGNGRAIYGDASTTYDSILATGKTIGYLNRGDYWGTIYKIHLDGTARSYQSAASIVRTSTDLAYERYFGNNESAGSMFAVYDDGYGNLNIEMNRLSSFSDDDNVNATLNNLTRAFYYYSPIDSPARVTQLGAPKGDGTETDMFFGFNTLGGVTTMLVPYPT